VIEFFRDWSENPFLWNGLWAGLLAGLACGITGPYVITKRIVFLAGAIAHIAVGGIGAALWLAHTFPTYFGSIHPIHGATIVAVISAIVIGLVNEHWAERSDTIIGALWAIGMAVGVLLIKFTPGYQGELMSYLFGNLAFVSQRQLEWIAFLDAVIILVTLLFHKQFLAVCLDQEQARLQGIPVTMINLLLLTVVALTVICLTSVVGLILVIALLSLPAATVARFVSSMLAMLIGSTILSCLLTTVPRIAVYGTPVNPESAIVITAATLYLGSLFLRRRTL
jgi:zinc transport system permease protein